MLLNSNSSYGLLTIILHWLIAVAIVGLFASGLYMLSIDYYHPLYQSLPHYHESIGVILALLLLARIVLRRLQVQPQPLQSGWQQRAALAMHLVLYVLPLAVIASGYFISAAEGEPIAVFNWLHIPAWQLNISFQADIAGWIHYYAAWLLLLLAGGHALAALQHHFINKDATLRRILKPRRPS